MELNRIQKETLSRLINELQATPDEVTLDYNQFGFRFVIKLDPPDVIEAMKINYVKAGDATVNEVEIKFSSFNPDLEVVLDDSLKTIESLIEKLEWMAMILADEEVDIIEMSMPQTFM